MDAGLGPLQVGEIAMTERMKLDVTRCSHWAPREIFCKILAMERGVVSAHRMEQSH